MNNSAMCVMVSITWLCGCQRGAERTIMADAGGSAVAFATAANSVSHSQETTVTSPMSIVPGTERLSGGMGGATSAESGRGGSGLSAIEGAGGVRAIAVGSDAGFGGHRAVAGSMAPIAPEFPAVTADQLGDAELISDAFELAESPVWDHCNARLIFVDVNKRKIHTFTPGAGVGVLVNDSNYVNGVIFDREGNFLMAEMGGGKGGRITRMTRDLTIEVIVDKDPDGAKLRTSDDLTVRSDGTIYFTDPVISHGPFSAGLTGLGSAPFYRVGPARTDGARPIQLAGHADLANGIRLSPDEKRLYVVGYTEGRVKQYDVAEDGSVTYKRALVSGLDAPDSMCLDAAGNLYIGVSSGVQVVSPDGVAIKLIRVRSSRGTTNCGFGGPDGKTLYVSGWNVLMKVENMPIPGLEWVRNRDILCP